MKRILIFSTDDHLYPAGGAEQAFGNITERLPHITFDLVCARLRKDSPKTEKVGNVNIYRIGFGVAKLDGILLALFGHFVAERLIKKNKYDLVWSIMASYGAFSAVRIKKKYKLPFLLTLQEGDSFEYIYRQVRFVRKQFNAIFKQADGIQAISSYLLNWGREMGYRGELGLVIPNGVAIKEFTRSYSREEIIKKRNSFLFPSTSTVLITASRLEIKNGITDVIEALPLLPESVCFVICGGGSLENKLKQRTKELGLEGRVLFLGFVDPSELPLLMKSSDMFIRPSLTEGLGNAFLEAMAARIITFGTEVGGIPDFLQDRKNGFVVEVENPESIASKINEALLLNDEEIENIKDDAERTVREKYDWDIIAPQMESLFEKICKQ